MRRPPPRAGWPRATHGLEGRGADRRRRGGGTRARSLGSGRALDPPDEPTYTMLGRSLWSHGTLTMLGDQAPFYGIVYPLLAGLPLHAFDAATGVDVLQGVQAIVMASTGLVVYAWARRVVSTGFALVATTLSLALPAFTYTGLVMTEAVYYPIATLALWAMARALERPTLERQALAVTAILLTSVTRLQGLALLPVLVTAVVATACFERSLRVVRRFALTLGLLVISGGIILALHQTGGSGDLLGAYATTAHTSYSLGPALRWIVWHAADVFLLVAGVPLLALAVLAVDGARGRERDPAARALLAIAISYTVWSVVQVGLFASHFAGVLIERNLVTVAPPLFIAFALWLQRGAPRPRPVMALAAWRSPHRVRARHAHADRRVRSPEWVHGECLHASPRLDLAGMGAGGVDRRGGGGRRRVPAPPHPSRVPPRRAHGRAARRRLGRRQRRRAPACGRPTAAALRQRSTDVDRPHRLRPGDVSRRRRSLLERVLADRVLEHAGRPRRRAARPGQRPAASPRHRLTRFDGALFTDPERRSTIHTSSPPTGRARRHTAADDHPGHRHRAGDALAGGAARAARAAPHELPAQRGHLSARRGRGVLVRSRRATGDAARQGRLAGDRRRRGRDLSPLHARRRRRCRPRRGPRTEHLDGAARAASGSTHRVSSARRRCSSCTPTIDRVAATTICASRTSTVAGSSCSARAVPSTIS